ncbi:MAG: N-6 DNA methylase [Dehalococcoidia bacterium]
MVPELGFSRIESDRIPNRIPELAQYFTPSWVCRLMVDHLSDINPHIVADIAVGKGELLWHAKRKWKHCQVFGFDIDKNLAEHCKERFGSGGYFSSADTLKKPSYDMIAIMHPGHSGGADLVLSNPPFGVIQLENVDGELAELLRRHKLATVGNGKKENVRAETAFFVKNLQILDNGGSLAILLPESVLSGAKTENFRRFVLQSTHVNYVLMLPVKSFDSNEARICVLVVQKNRQRKERKADTTIGIKSSKRGRIVRETINQNQLLKRMDPKFHLSWNHFDGTNTRFMPLAHYVSACRRGHGFYNEEKKLITKEAGRAYLHSVDIDPYVLRELHKLRTVPESVAERSLNAWVRNEDILLVRVGKGCAGRCGIALGLDKGGFASDCLYVIRSKSINPYYLCLFLNSSFAKKYLDACKRGVSSQYITKDDLLNLPIFVPDVKTVRTLANTFAETVHTPICSENPKAFSRIMKRLIRRIDILTDNTLLDESKIDLGYADESAESTTSSHNGNGSE